ncbi:MAG: DNA-binding GntR family transcriptional regulator [bacterium]|jgi:DNA-binding GntR family transcriptional regulator
MSKLPEKGQMSISANLRPVTTNFSLKEHIYDVLRTAIMEMDIYSEDIDLRLDERKLAEQLGISRTPIREALAKLEQEGFVDIQARKGVYVKPKTLEEVLEMVVVWAALESMAARLVTQVASDEEIRTLRELGVKHSEDSNRAEIEEYSEANIKFHQLILELSKCSLLKNTADSLLQHMHAVRRRAMREGDRIDRSVVDHMAIIEAIENREGELAAMLVRDHTMKLHDHIRKSWMAIGRQSVTGRS